MSSEASETTAPADLAAEVAAARARLAELRGKLSDVRAMMEDIERALAGVPRQPPSEGTPVSQIAQEEAKAG